MMSQCQSEPLWYDARAQREGMHQNNEYTSKSQHTGLFYGKRKHLGEPCFNY